MSLEKRLAGVIPNQMDAFTLQAFAMQSGRYEGRATLAQHINQLLFIDKHIARQFPHFAEAISMETVKQIHVAHDLPEAQAQLVFEDGKPVRRIVTTDLSHSQPDYAALRRTRHEEEQRRWLGQRLHYSPETREQLDGAIATYETREQQSSLAGHTAKAIDLAAELLFATRNGESGNGLIYDALRAHHTTLSDEAFVRGPLREHMSREAEKFLAQSQKVAELLPTGPTYQEALTEHQAMTVIILQQVAAYCNSAFREEVMQLLKQISTANSKRIELAS